jgi:hypothetical protein
VPFLLEKVLITDWLDESKTLKQQGKSWSEIGSIIQKKYFPDEDKGKIKERVRSRLRDTPEYKKGNIIYEDKRDIKPQSVDEYFDALKALNNAIDELDTKQTSATFRIDESKPIAISFWGDRHLGERGVDYNRFEQES